MEHLLNATELDAASPGRPPDAVTASGGRRPRLGDPLFRVATTACGATVAVAMFGLAGVLVYRSIPSVSALGIEVLTTVAWSPVNGQYGALAALAGTVLSTLVAMVISVPLALAIALLLVDLVPPRVARVLGTGIEMLAAIPSIVFGMVGIFVIEIGRAHV